MYTSVTVPTVRVGVAWATRDGTCPSTRVRTRLRRARHQQRGVRDVHGTILRLAVGLGTYLEHRPTSPPARARGVQDPAEHHGILARPRRERVHLVLLPQPHTDPDYRLRLVALRRLAGDRRIRPGSAGTG